MAALYPPWANTAFRLALIALVLVAAGVIVGPMLYVRSPYDTRQYQAVEQPVEFDHRHHARDDGIDCLYCHAGAEEGASAGLPPTELCMGCHAQIRNQSPLLDPVRRSYFSGDPIPWNRVHDLADFVYFNHAVHVTGADIPCARCHGPVEDMARVYQFAPLTMGWCLDCHRNPEPWLGPAADAPELASAVQMRPRGGDGVGGVTRLTTCSACHR